MGDDDEEIEQRGREPSAKIVAPTSRRPCVTAYQILRQPTASGISSFVEAASSAVIPNGTRRSFSRNQIANRVSGTAKLTACGPSW
jgi:hypothetical protein